MNLEGHRCADFLQLAAGRLDLPNGWPKHPLAASLPFDRWVDALPLIISATAVLLGGAAVFFAVRARQVAHSALQEAGEAKARAQASGPPLSSEALAAVERVWSTRLNAIESQIQNLSRPSRPAASPVHSPSPELSARIDEIEKAVHGLSIVVAQGRRAQPAAPHAAATEPKWPAVLTDEKDSVKELRDLLREGARTTGSDLEKLFLQLKGAEAWSAKRRPSSAEVISFLSDISQSFYNLLRKGASLPASEASRMADRLVGLLRPIWQQYHPEIDCRVFYPGAPFDPEWMEDQNPAGLQRPTISDIFSWAIHEKHLTGRRLMTKARVSTE